MRTAVLRFRAHQVIKRPNEAIDRVYTLKEGWACRSVMFQDGRRQILSFMLPGDTICVEGICVEDYALPYQARALTDVTLCSFSPTRLHDVVFASEQQREFFARYVLEQKALAERRLADIGRRRAMGSLAQLVLELFRTLSARGLAEGTVIDFPLRQEDIADALGLTPAHVNRTLVLLKRRGVMEISQSKLRVMDMAELLATAIDN